MGAHICKRGKRCYNNELRSFSYFFSNTKVLKRFIICIKLLNPSNITLLYLLYYKNVNNNKNEERKKWRVSLE
jgi:hypothetical protein